MPTTRQYRPSRVHGPCAGFLQKLAALVGGFLVKKLIFQLTEFKVSTPFAIGTHNIVQTWEALNASKTSTDQEQKKRVFAAIIPEVGNPKIGCSAWDKRNEHDNSVISTFTPALRRGYHAKFGYSCAEKDATLKLLKDSFKGNFGSLQGEHERCEPNYFKVIREKIKENHGDIHGTVSMAGASQRKDMTYLEDCDGCYNMLVRRENRIFSAPDLVRNEKANGKIYGK